MTETRAGRGERDLQALELAGQAAEVTRWSREMRDRYVRSAHSAGWSYREIGQATGIHYKSVERIVRGEGEEPDGA